MYGPSLELESLGYLHISSFLLNYFILTAKSSLQLNIMTLITKDKFIIHFVMSILVCCYDVIEYSLCRFIE